MPRGIPEIGRFDKFCLYCREAGIRIKDISYRVTIAVREVFLYADNYLTRRFFPKYLDVIYAISNDLLTIKEMHKSDIHAFMFFRFLFAPEKWSSAVRFIENQYRLSIIKTDYTAILENIYINLQTNELAFSSSPLTSNTWKNLSAKELVSIPTINFAHNLPCLLSSRRQEEIDVTLRHSLTPHLYTKFLRTISFNEENASKGMINNVHLLLSILRLNSYPLLGEWEIDTDSMEIRGEITIGEFATNEDSLHLVNLDTYIQKTFTKETMGTIWLPVLDLFTQKYRAHIEESKHFTEVLKALQETGEV